MSEDGSKVRNDDVRFKPADLSDYTDIEPGNPIWYVIYIHRLHGERGREAYRILIEPMGKLLEKMKGDGFDLSGQLSGKLEWKDGGGHADVYLGRLIDGTAVAVKQPRPVRLNKLKKFDLCKVRLPYPSKPVVGP